MEYCLCFAMTKVMLLVFFMATSASASSSALSSTYYDSTCPKALETVKSVVKSAVAQEKRMGASLLRLHFHDCFVNGCDASVLLDDTSTFTGEKSANPNANSIRGFSVVDDVKSQLESVCAGVVSCADILAIAARDAVVELGGPSWTVPLGRRDSLTANMTAANTQIPGPTSNLSTLISSFSAQGLSTYEMVALSGSHTVGQGRCKNFRSRIYNDTDINSFYASSLQSNCSSDSGDDNLSPLDAGTPTEFDTSYYTHLLYMEGLLHSDQQLYSGDGSGSTDSLVRYYSFAKTKFFSDFASAMVKMGNISPLTGSNGEIRTNCRTPNSAS